MKAQQECGERLDVVIDSEKEKEEEPSVLGRCVLRKNDARHDKDIFLRKWTLAFWRIHLWFLVGEKGVGCS